MPLFSIGQLWIANNEANCNLKSLVGIYSQVFYVAVIILDCHAMLFANIGCEGI